MAKIVMVDVLTSFRNRYAVEVGDDHPDEWALDTVVCEMHDPEKLKEFSQFHIGDQVISHRVVSEDQYISLFDQDNDYLKSWSIEKKLSYINRENDLNKQQINPDLNNATTGGWPTSSKGV